MLQPPAEQQEEGAEPRRTREFITRRHSRLVDEKSLLEFVEQYSPLAKSKKRGIESTTSDDIENAHPNSPTLSGSPRPTKRRSLSKEGILIGDFLSGETLNFFQILSIPHQRKTRRIDQFCSILVSIKFSQDKRRKVCLKKLACGSDLALRSAQMHLSATLPPLFTFSQNH